MASQSVSAEKRYRMSLLLDAYGELLTEKQRTFLRRYYEEDYSFGEIARDFNVTRQAIFDSVKHGEAALEHFENVLGLVDRSSKSAENKDVAGLSGDTAGQIQDAETRLRELSREISMSSVDADTGWITRELGLIADELAGLAEGPESRGKPAAESVQAAPAPRQRTEPESRVLGGGPEID